MLEKIGIKNIIVTVFVVGAIFAFMIFTGAVEIGSDAKKVKGKIVVWGTTPYNVMQPFIDMVSSNDLVVSYKAQDKSTYETDLINAFASGNGPDLFIMPHEKILRHSDKIFKIPYTSFPRNQYESNYIHEAQLFLAKDGILAIPVSVDPLVMYYNKQLIASSFLIGVPEYWEDFTKFVSDITVATPNGYVSIAGTALGTYENIDNAKAILSTILQQNGNSIVGNNPSTGQKQSILSLGDEQSQKAIQSLGFYVSFARNGAKNYSWNEASVSSRQKFIAGELAFYFGRASEIETIRKKNPNLDFDVTFTPQISDTSLKSTYGAMTGIAIAKQTKNVSAAIEVASKISGKDVSKGLTAALNIAPARFDLLKDIPESEYLTTIYKSAIISKGWVDPDPKATSMLFKNMIRSINTGSQSMNDTLRKTNADLNIILNRTINMTIKNRITEAAGN